MNALLHPEVTPLGKLLGRRLYVHSLALASAPSDLQAAVAKAMALATQSEPVFNVIRFDLSDDSIALLDYPRFFDDACPALSRSWRISFAKCTVSHRDYSGSLNPPILHRKELLLESTDARRSEFADLTAQLESLGLFDDPVRIGFRLQWERLLEEHGFRLVGHALLPVGNVEFELDDVVDAALPQPIERHLTALTRYNYSAPIQLLDRFGLFEGDASVFDYGCGKGDDLKGLISNGISATGWDPHFAPDRPIVPADIVNLGFVINVIEDPAERRDALVRAFELARRVLAVSTMIASEDAVQGTPFADGILTGRNTFQKYYTQSELRQYLTEVLEQDPISVAPGVFFVFCDKTLEQRFQARRFRGRIRLSPAPRAPRPPCAPRTVVQRPRQPDLYELHFKQFDALWQQWLEFGREPEESEILESVELVAAAGSFRRALRLTLSHHDERQLVQARRQRSEDLLVYLALQEFRRCPPFKQLEARLQRDVRALFGDYRSARAQAQQLLHQVASSELLDQSCRQAAESGLGFLEDSQSLQLHSSLVPRLPGILRVYVGCAEVLYGDIGHADLVKIHIRSGKVTLLKFENFLTSPLPRLLERVKINLRALDVRLFEYGDTFTAPYLYLKSRYLNEEMPGYAEQLAFDERLESLGVVDLAAYGPSAAEFEAALSEARWKIDGFSLMRADSVPELDARCGRYLTYRDLVQSGETQARLNISNLPKSPESYTALHDLATSILDPVIEYFGAIKLTYGFCSAELSKNIVGRVTPALDQHAAHERKRSGSPICARLGAAADFLVEQENMREVADWISANLPFDRLYYYGPDRPIHVSFGPEAKGEFVEMRATADGRRIPRVRKID